MGVHYPTQDLHILAASASRSATTYAYNLPPVREHRGVTILISNTVSGASGTLDAKLRWKNPISLVYTDLPSAAFVQWGAGTTGEKFLQMYAGLTGSDADSKLTVSTDFVEVNWFPLRDLQLYVTVGTGAITFSAVAYYLP